MNFFEQGLFLGRWFRISVVIHWTFLLYAFWEFRASADFLWTTLILLTTFGCVLLHEFGHCFGCRAVKGEAFHVLLWPMGGLAFVSPPLNATAHLVTVVCGPLVNLILWGIFWVVGRYAFPFLVPHFAPDSQVLDLMWNFVYAMIWVNRIQFLFNVLMPVFPMDGGRILQCILWYILGYRRSLLIAGMTGTVGGGAFILLGFGIRSITLPVLDITLGDRPNILFVCMGIFFMLQSFGVYRQALLIGTWRKN